MKPAPVIAVLLVALAGGAAVYMLLGGGSAPPRPEGRGGAEVTQTGEPDGVDVKPPPVTGVRGSGAERTLLAEDEDPHDLPPKSMLTAAIGLSIADAETGQALSGARVDLWSGGKKQKGALPVPFSDYAADGESDATGRASIQVPKIGVFSMRVTKDGYAPKQLGPVMPGDELTVRLIRGRVLEGVVADAETGEPVAEALVRAMFEGDAAEALTDGESGAFAIRDLSSGLYTIEVLADGYDVHTQTGIQVGTTAAVPLDVKLRPGVRLLGTVTDADSEEPIEDAAVIASVRRVLRDEQSELLLLETTTDAAGAFELEGVSRSDVDLTIESPGYAGFRDRLRLDEESVEETIEVKMIPGLEVSGRVLDPRGAPAAKATVRLGGVTTHEVAERTVTADEDGRFRFVDVRPGASFQIVAVSKDVRVAPTISERLTVYAQTPVEDVELRLRTGATVVGSVVDDDANPVPHARVLVEGLAPLMWKALGESSVRYADENGEFELVGMPEELIVVSARHRDILSQSTTVKLMSEQEHEVRLRLSSGVLLEGLVMNLMNAPVDDVLVTAYAQAPELSVAGGAAGQSKRAKDLITRAKGSQNAGARILQGVTGGKANTTATRGFARSDETGQFAIPGLEPGVPIALELRHDDYATKFVFNVIPGTGDVRVKMTPMLVLTGRVVESGSRRAVTKFVVSARPTRQDDRVTTLEAALAQKTSVTRQFQSADGTFSMSGLEAGRYDITVLSAGYKKAPAQQVKLAPNYPTDVQFELDAAAVVEGIVVAPDGSPIPRMPVFLRPKQASALAAGADKKPKAMTRTTTWEGTFRITEVDAGAYSIGLGKMGAPVVGPIDLIVEEGQDVYRELRLEATGGLLVEVRSFKGFPLSKADVTFRGNTSGMTVRRRTDAKGRVAFGALFPEPGMIVVAHKAHALFKKDVTIQAFDERREEVALKPK